MAYVPPPLTGCPADSELNPFQSYRTTDVILTVSTALYGFNIALAIGCLRLLLTQKDALGSRLRLALVCTYIAAMVGLASQVIVHNNLNIFNATLSTLNSANCGDLVYTAISPDMPIAVPMTVCGADLVLVCIIWHFVSYRKQESLDFLQPQVYRCIILYKSAGRAKRVLVYGFLVFAAIGSLGGRSVSFSYSQCGLSLITFEYTSAAGVVAIIISTEYADTSVVFIAVAPVTAFVNGVISSLIAGRLIYAHRLLARVQSDHLPRQQRRSSPYITALAICVESSALILVTVAVSFVFTYVAPEMLVPQICVSNHGTRRSTTTPLSDLPFR